MQWGCTNGCYSHRNQERSAEDWLENIDKLRDVMQSSPGDRGGKYERIRICVIDTGLREDYKTTCSAFRGFRDFVNPANKRVCDESSSRHGTCCGHIILSVFDECELYVARVFADDNADDKTGPARMAEAIEWAMSKDVRADIISISAGFLEESPKLEEAVRKASAANRLIFASASNWGNVDGVAFPARHAGTICIFSTDTADKPSKFNPEPRQDAHNFALLGEGWQSYADPQKYNKGTSMATAAAAGLAALILDFSRQSDNKDTFWAGQVLQTSSMVAIFHAISKPAGRFRCVEPKHLLMGYGSVASTAGGVAGPDLGQRRDWARFKIQDAIMKKILGMNP
ncbi:subtilisin BL [Parachaetomium inaequale]|uniref:Subtilisin BL n=1 Tax=Parachaetomium inaequale TaxID=2588326 RepID=A0AAN6PJ25_9PEZI|nr:subtilisin BL [Parachaetomium inaequale]